jgi:hypothetical protein
VSLGSTYNQLDVGADAMNLRFQAQFAAMAFSFVLLFPTSALACEKHINGHQRSSDTNAEASNR